MSPATTVQRAVAHGTVRAPPSKSVTHRAHLLAAHTEDIATVDGPLRAADTDATLACLRQLGADAAPAQDGVRFGPAAWKAPDDALDCCNSGTTLRLLLGLAARLPGTTRFDGDASLRARPNAPLLDALRRGGATVPAGADALPLQVAGPLRSGAYSLPARTSSQYASSLLLSLPFLGGDSTLRLDAPVSSRPYLDVTAHVARAFGLRLEATHAADGLVFHVPGGQAVAARTAYPVEGDWSGAAFPLVAAAVTSGTVTVEGLRADSPQGDRAVLDVLRAFGATVSGTTVTADPDALASPGPVDVAATPDLFPILAVLAARAHGTTTFTGGAALRHKESDRIAAMAEGLTRLGADVRERPDGLVVTGAARLRGATVRGHHDHRVHMALCVAGLAADGPVTVSDPDSAAVSYPGFHADLDRLTRAGDDA